MINYNNLNFDSIKKYLETNSIKIKSTLSNNYTFKKISTLDLATSEDLTFFHNTKYLNFLKNTKAKACLIENEYISYLNKNCIPIIVDNSHLTYSLISNLLEPPVKSNGIINVNSNIDKNSILKNNVQINSFVIIKSKCTLENNVIIYDNSVIGPNVTIGENSIISSSCVISNTNIGKNCLIQSGAIIGGKGFGFATNEKIDIKHIGNVEIGNNVDIGSNTTIDRASINSTTIGDNCRIDNLVQIAHNVKIGNNCTIAAQTGISGSTILGNNCLMGGQVGIAGHLKIGDNVVIAAKSGVTKDIISNSRIAGFPARDIKLWKKSVIKQFKDIK